jgi:DNA repair exonuclease SbcCD ATPase subunit
MNGFTWFLSGLFAGLFLGVGAGWFAADHLWFRDQIETAKAAQLTERDSYSQRIQELRQNLAAAQNELQDAQRLAHQDHREAEERLATADEAYRLARKRFELARLVGQLRQFASELRHQPAFEQVHEDTSRLLDYFTAAAASVNDKDLASTLKARRQELELVLFPERGSSTSAADGGRDTLAALRSLAKRTAAELDTWIERHQPSY